MQPGTSQDASGTIQGEIKRHVSIGKLCGYKAEKELSNLRDEDIPYEDKTGTGKSFTCRKNDNMTVFHIPPPFQTREAMLFPASPCRPLSLGIPLGQMARRD